MKRTSQSRSSLYPEQWIRSKRIRSHRRGSTVYTPNLIGIYAAAALCACTTSLESVPADPSLKMGIQEGVAYSLPIASLSVDFHFLVTDCKSDNGKSRLFHELRTADIKRILIPDPGNRYFIPYKNLSATTKTTNLSIDFHPSGMISTIKPELNDKSAEILGNVASGVMNLALSRVPGIGGAAATPSSLPLQNGSPATSCPAIMKLIKEREGLIGELAVIRNTEQPGQEVREAKIKRLEEEINKLEAALKKTQTADEGSRDDTEIDTLKKNLEAKKKELADEIKTPSERSTIQGKLATIEKHLTLTVSLSGWIPRPEKERTLPKEGLCIQANTPHATYLSKLQRAGFNVSPDSAADKKFQAKVCIRDFIAITDEAKKSKADDITSTERPPEKETSGLIYRIPAYMRIEVTDVSGPGEPPPIPSVIDAITMPQFGYLAALPLKNGPFDKNYIDVKFHEDGSLVKFTFANEQAAAETATGAFNNITGSVLEYMQKRDAASSALAATRDSASADALDSLEKQISILDSLSKLQGGAASSSANQEIIQLMREIQIQRLKRELQLLSK